MAGWIAAGAAVAGDLISGLGTSNTNQTNEEIAQQNNAFNAQQAQLNRDFQATESATAMQVRVADDKAAGLNPALAYQQGGATAMPGSTASAASNPQLSNPMASFGNFGSQASSAMALNSQQAQIDLMKAQADKTTAETNTVLPAQVQSVQSVTALNDVRQAEAYKNLQMLQSMLLPPDSVTSGSSMFSQQYLSKTNMATAQAAVSQMTAQEKADTLATAIAVRNSQNVAEKAGFDNLYWASSGDFGKFMALFRLGQPAISSAGNVADYLGAGLDVAP